MVDKQGYQEKVITAWNLRGKEDPWSVLQKQDAADVIQKISISELFPVRISGKWVMRFLLLVVLLFGSGMLDSPVRQAAWEQHDLQRDKKEELTKVEKVQKAVTQKETISKEEAADALQELTQTKKELTEAESRRDLQLAKERYLKKLQQTAQNTKNKTLQQMLQQQAEQTKKEQEAQTEALAKQAEQALEQAKNGSRKDKQNAYAQGKKYAQSSGLTDMEQELEDYKQSGYSSSDYVKVKAAMTQAMTKGRQDAKSAKNSTGSSLESANASNAEGKQQGQGGQADSKAAANTRNGAASSGGAATGESKGNQSGSGWNRGSNVGQEGNKKTTDTVTIPEKTMGDDENLTGKMNDSDQVQSARANQANATAGSKVEYGQVSAEYKQKAYKQIDGASYPNELKNQIRDYFDGLN